MGTIQGRTRAEKLVFGQTHGTVWKTGFASIGITEAEGTAYSAKVTAAADAKDDMEAAHEAAKAATLLWHTKCDAMSNDASILLGKIKSYARSQPDPNVVYAAALIPAPATPTPAGAPTNCSNLEARLNNDGSVELSWTGTLANGQFFSVWRKLSSETTWTQLGSVAAKKFTDTEVPEGLTGGQYKVLSHRGTSVSTGCEPIVVVFGTIPMAA